MQLEMTAPEMYMVRVQNVHMLRHRRGPTKNGGYVCSITTISLAIPKQQYV